MKPLLIIMVPEGAAMFDVQSKKQFLDRLTESVSPLFIETSDVDYLQMKLITESGVEDIEFNLTDMMPPPVVTVRDFEPITFESIKAVKNKFEAIDAEKAAAPFIELLDRIRAIRNMIERVQNINPPSMSGGIRMEECQCEMCRMNRRDWNDIRNGGSFEPVDFSKKIEEKLKPTANELLIDWRAHWPFESSREFLYRTSMLPSEFVAHQLGEK